MASFGQEFLKGFFGSDYLKDYRHASKTFLANGAELLPKQKFLYHVYFNLNTAGIPRLRSAFNTTNQSELGLMVKSVQLPSFQIDTDELNQYNRTRIIQKKIKYQPVQITFHDDGADLIRKLWYNYFTYYFKDPGYRYGTTPTTDGTQGNDATPPGFSYNDRNPYENTRTANDWGYVGESYTDGTSGKSGKPPFFLDIRVFGMSQHRFYEYTLINPMIEQWQHDTYDYSSSDPMTHTCTIRYETVKYKQGVLGRQGSPLNGFVNQGEHYDTSPSSLSRPGSTASILGPGGLLDAGIGIYNDLEALATGRGNLMNVIGAVQQAGRTYETLKNKDLQAIINQEAIDNAKKVLRSSTLPTAVRQASNSSGGFGFPTASNVNTTNTTATGTPPFVPGPNTAGNQ